LDAEKWYSVNESKIRKAGGGGLLWQYNGSHIKALIELYPEIILKERDFLRSKWGWKETEKQRKFFDEFARSKNFNPLDSEKWYFVSQQEIHKAGGSGLLNYYEGSHIKALMKLYPELILKKSNFRTMRKGLRTQVKEL